MGEGDDTVGLPQVNVYLCTFVASSWSSDK